MYLRNSGKLILVASLAIVVFGCTKQKVETEQKPSSASEVATPEPNKTKGYETPQAVFDAAFAASQRQDDAAFIACAGSQAQKEMAAREAFAFLQQQRMAEDGGPASKAHKEDFKLICAVYDKHGLKYEVTKQLKVDLDDPRQRSDVERALQSMIKDPVAFYVEIKAAVAKTTYFGPPPKAPPVEARLTEVKIDGDSATGVIVIKDQGQEFKQPVQFVKEAGGWKLGPEVKSSGENLPTLPPPQPTPKPPADKAVAMKEAEAVFKQGLVLINKLADRLEKVKDEPEAIALATEHFKTIHELNKKLDGLGLSGEDRQAIQMKNADELEKTNKRLFAAGKKYPTALAIAEDGPPHEDGLIPRDVKQPKPTASWSGSLDEAPKLPSTDDGAITDSKTFEAAWAALRPGEKLPTVDFKKNFAYVGLGREGIYRPIVYMSTEPPGDMVITTHSLGHHVPGYRYFLLVFPREGVKTVNERALKP